MRFINEELLIRRAQEKNLKGANDGNTTLISALKRQIDAHDKRILNLRVFKELFFTQQAELIAEKEKNQQLEQSIQALKGLPVDQPTVPAPVKTEPANARASESTTESRDNAESANAQTHSDNSHSDDDLEEAKDLILLSLQITNEYICLLECLDDINKAANIVDLTKQILKSLGKIGLSGAIQIRSKYGVTNEYFNTEKQVAYESLIYRFKLSGPQHRYEDIYIYNKEKISILIGNLPDNAATEKRLIHNIGYIIDACNTKILNIDNQKHLNNQHKNLKTLVEGTHTSISLIQQANDQQLESINFIFNDISKELTAQLQSLEIENNEKKNLLDFIDKKRETVTEIISQSIQLDQKFVGVINQLRISFNKNTPTPQKKTETGKTFPFVQK